MVVAKVPLSAITPRVACGRQIQYNTIQSAGTAGVKDIIQEPGPNPSAPKTKRANLRIQKDIRASISYQRRRQEQEQAKVAESAAISLQVNDNDNDDEFPGILRMRLDTEFDEAVVLPKTMFVEWHSWHHSHRHRQRLRCQ